MVKLYILEDEHAMSDVLADFFKSEGYEVASSRDGTGAADAILSAQPDLLLLDQILPGENGIDVLDKLRQRNFQAPVILLTNNDKETFDQAQLQKLGVIECYTKSDITLPSLSEVIWRSLRKK